MVVTGFDRASLLDVAAREGSVVRVVIARFQGSTPRETGAAMLVWANGQSGTIGGGALELEATEAARRLLRDETPWARQVMQLPLGPALGQCCGGHVTLLLERYAATECAALAGIAEEAFLRPIRSGPPESGLAAARQRRATRAGEIEPGLVGDLMIEPFARPATPVWLYGAGHVGRAIVRVAEGLPLAITWIDTDRARFPEAIPAHVDPLIATNPARIVPHAPDDAVHLVLTYSHALDLEICHAVLSRPRRHLGLIGSASKRARFLSRLRALGHPDPAFRCPIGDRALGKLPAAIALGVVTELLRLPEAASQTRVLKA